MSDEKTKLKRKIHNLREVLKQTEEKLESSNIDEAREELENGLNNTLNPNGVVIEFNVENYRDRERFFVGDTENVGCSMTVKKEVAGILFRL